jgi:heme/copper-type cytochrome/quinol oxidase subunit 3
MPKEKIQRTNYEHIISRLSIFEYFFFIFFIVLERAGYKNMTAGLQKPRVSCKLIEMAMLTLVAIALAIAHHTFRSKRSFLVFVAALVLIPEGRLLLAVLFVVVIGMMVWEIGRCVYGL